MQFSKIGNVKGGYLFLLNVLFISFAFPSPPLTNIVLFTTLAVAIVSTLKNRNLKKKSFTGKKYVAISTLILISAFLSGLINNENLLDSQVTKNLFFLAIPLLFFLGPKINYKQKQLILSNFVISVFIFSLLGVFKIIILYILDIENKLFYESFSNVLKIHSTYFALLVVVAFIVSTVRIFKQRKAFHFKYIFISFYFLIILFLLSSRISFVAIALILVVFFIDQVILKKRKKAVFFFAGVAVCVSIFIFSGYFGTRINNLTQENEANRSDIENREVLWESVFCAIENSPSQIFGAGLKKSQDIINSCYSKNGFFGAELNYNAHNQYLQTLLEKGLLGLLFLLLLMGYLLFRGFRKKDVLLILTTITFFVFFVTESILERQLGIMLFVSFNTMLIFNNNRDEPNLV